MPTNGALPANMASGVPLRLYVFASTPGPLILDENLAATGMAAALREQGYNLRTIKEIFGANGIPDNQILELANMLDARVLTRDVGRQLDGGFFERAIVVDSRVRTPESILRILETTIGKP